MSMRTDRVAMGLWGVAIVACVAVSAQGQTTNFWINAGSGVFQNGTNWNTGTAPAASGDTAVFRRRTVGTITSIVPITNWSWGVQSGNITFNVGDGRTNTLKCNVGSSQLMIGASNATLAQATFSSGTWICENADNAVFVGHYRWPMSAWVGSHASSTNVLMITGANTSIRLVKTYLGIGQNAMARVIVTNGASLVCNPDNTKNRVQIWNPPSAGKTTLFHVSGQGSSAMLYAVNSGSPSLKVGWGSFGKALVQVDAGGYVFCPWGALFSSAGGATAAVLRVIGASAGGTPSEFRFQRKPLQIGGVYHTTPAYGGATLEILAGGRVTAGNDITSHLLIGVAASSLTTGRVMIAGTDSLYVNAGVSREYTNQVGQIGGGIGYLTVTDQGTLRTTNTMGRAALDVQRGAVMLDNGGNIVVDRLRMTSVTGTFDFRGGLLDIRHAVVSNAVPFTVGNGVGLSATLALRGGTNRFWHGCEIATDGRLTGVGLADGTVTVSGTVAPGRSGPGTLKIAGLLDLNPESRLEYELGAPGYVGEGTNDLIVVQGDVDLGGRLSVVPLEGFGYGTYTLMTYSGALLGNSLAMSTNRPAGCGYTLRVDGAQVLLDVSRPRGSTIILR